MSVSPAEAVAPMPRASATSWALAALAVSVAGVVGSLTLSWGLHLKACPLCFYQRAFMMGLVGVLSMGLFAGAARPGRLGLLALPLAVAGLGVASFHVWLELAGKLECPGGLFGLGTAPKQSLAVFLVLSGFLTVSELRGPAGPGAWMGLAGAALLGALLATASCTSNPPPLAAPVQPYATPLDVCRPPFRAG